MDKKIFEITLYEKKKLVEIWHRYEFFRINLEDDDEWISFTTEDGNVYDMHLLLEGGLWQVSVYASMPVLDIDGLSLMETDVSEEGQQVVNLTVFYGD